MFNFTKFEIPPHKNKLEGDDYENLKINISVLMTEQRTDVFDKQESVKGKWASLKDPNTKQSKRKSFKKKSNKEKKNILKKDKILQDTRVLLSSFSDAPGSGKSFQRISTDGDEVMNETNVEYAATHNFGDESRNIPARNFSDFSEEDTAEIYDLVEVHIDG